MAAGASRDNLRIARVVTSAHCGRRQAAIRSICFCTGARDFEYAAKSGWGEIRGQLTIPGGLKGTDEAKQEDRPTEPRPTVLGR